MPNIVKLEHIKIGDRVVASPLGNKTTIPSEDNQSYTAKGIAGNVIGFGTTSRIVSKKNTWKGVRNGIWSINSSVLVSWSDHTFTAVAPVHLSFEDHFLLDERESDESDEAVAYAGCINEPFMTGKLPTVPYYEGDTVMVYPVHLEDFTNPIVKHGVIDSIDYAACITFKTAKVRYGSIYRVIIDNQLEHLSEQDIKGIVVRGPYFNYEHNLPLVFKSVPEEFGFYISLRMVDTIDTDIDSVAWTNEALYASLKDGSIDAARFSLVSKSPTNNNTGVGYCYIDDTPYITEEVMVRAREYYIKQYEVLKASGELA